MSGRSYDGPKHRSRVAKAKARAEGMAALYIEGWTLAQIGAEYEISRERVRQLLRKYTEVTRDEGGQKKQMADRASAKEAERDARYLAKFGCGFAAYQSTPLQARKQFRQQRINAQRREIGWHLTFWEWWTLWRNSGRWQERGRGQGYVMCRRGDTGPYAVGNVFIALARVNTSQRRGKKTDLPMGVGRRGVKFFAQRMINGDNKYLGTFQTPALAHAAYLRAGESLNERHSEAS